jgi:hypothetical protein
MAFLFIIYCSTAHCLCTRTICILNFVPADATRPLERFPITWNHVIEKESLKFKELEHVLVEKVEQLFRDML